jgi:hypothetical protein
MPVETGMTLRGSEPRGYHCERIANKYLLGA